MLRQGMRAQDIAEKLFPGNAKSMRNDNNIPKALIDATVSAKRLARTEAAAREDELTDIFFKENKIKYFDWVTEPGACKKCLVIGALGPYKVDDEASPRIPGSSHPNCRCRRIPTEVEADEKADSLKKALAAGIVSGIGKRDNKEENTEEDIQYTYTEGDKNDSKIYNKPNVVMKLRDREGEIKTYRIFDNDGKLKERKSWRKHQLNQNLQFLKKEAGKMIRVKSDVIKERLDWLKFELSINDELETVIGGKTCYLGPAFNNKSYEDKEGWVLYPYDLSYEIYIPYTNPEKQYPLKQEIRQQESILLMNISYAKVATKILKYLNDCYENGLEPNIESLNANRLGISDRQYYQTL